LRGFAVLLAVLLVLAPAVASAQSNAAVPRPDRFFRGHPTTASFLEVEPSSVGLDRDALIAVDSMLLAAVRDSVVRHASIAVGYKGKIVRLRSYGWTQRDSARLATPATEYDVTGLLDSAPRVIAAIAAATPDLFARLEMEDTGPDSTGTSLSSSAFDLAILADLATRGGVAPACRPQVGSGVPCTRERPSSIPLARTAVPGDSTAAASTRGPIWLYPDLYVVLLVQPGPLGVTSGLARPVPAAAAVGSIPVGDLPAAPPEPAPNAVEMLRQAVREAVLRATGR
jgi:hypothetical protein